MVNVFQLRSAEHALCFTNNNRVEVMTPVYDVVQQDCCVRATQPWNCSTYLVENTSHDCSVTGDDPFRFVPLPILGGRGTLELLEVLRGDAPYEREP
ncbi:hypothetical protein [Rathayibacter agropyri]